MGDLDVDPPSRQATFERGRKSGGNLRPSERKRDLVAPVENTTSPAFQDQAEAGAQLGVRSQRVKKPACQPEISQLTL